MPPGGHPTQFCTPSTGRESPHEAVSSVPAVLSGMPTIPPKKMITKSEKERRDRDKIDKLVNERLKEVLPDFLAAVQKHI